MPFDPSVTVFDQTYANPVMVASGTFGCGEVYGDLLDYKKIGGFVTKAVTVEARSGNKGQRLVETPSGLLNSIGLQNEGLDVFVKEKLPQFASYPCKVWVNVSGSDFEGYKKIIETIGDREHVTAFEVNVSCPNVAHGGMTIGTSCNDVYEITKLLKGCTKKPLIIKLTPNVTSIADLAKSAQDGGADGLTVANTFLGMDIDAEKRRPVLGNITGGLSGPAIKPLALRCVWQVFNAVKIPIIGCGGITTGLDAIEFIMAGAKLVQVGTAIFKEPTAPARIAQEMADWMDVHKYKSFAEIEGVAHEAK